MGLKVLSFDSLDVGSTIQSYSAKHIQKLLKGIIDCLGAGMLLILLAPFLLIVACLIRSQDGGPAIYRRRVVGPKGEFDAYKFRTMCVDADEMLASNPHMNAIFERDFKLTNDPRITKLGVILRKCSIDELPQLFNILKGEMSLVGPRMITAVELKKYGRYGAIFSEIKPGLTGYWQVSGRQKVSYNERVQMDMSYIKNWSLLLDLHILCKTPAKVISREGAY